MLPNTFEGSMVTSYELVPVPVPVSTGVVTTGRSRSGHRIHDEGTYSSVRGVATPRRESCASRGSTPRPGRRHAGEEHLGDCGDSSSFDFKEECLKFIPET